MKRIEVIVMLAVLLAVLLVAAFRMGFREGQLKYSLGLRYYFYDGGGSEVYDPTLALRGVK